MIWNPKFECMKRSELERLQLERLKAVVKRVYDKVPAYRKKMDDINLKPEHIKSLADLKNLPFTTKQDLLDNYPFGMLAVPKEDIIRFQSSSGIGGEPVLVAYTKNDIAMWAEVVARTITCGGGTKNDVLQVAYEYGLFTGGLGLHYGGELIGCKIIPASSGKIKRQIMIMTSLGTTILACTPSMALTVADTITEMGLEANKLSLRVGLFGAECWSEKLRLELQRRLKITAIDIYGLSEVVGPGVASECEYEDGLHIAEDHFLPEIVQPQADNVLDYGERGELVFTTLTKEALPLIRYRTGDISSLNLSPCRCKRTTSRMARIHGRTDDLLSIQGIKIFPLQVESVLMGIEGLKSNFFIVADKKGGMEQLELLIEVNEQMFSNSTSHLQTIKAKIESEINTVLGVPAVVRLVEPKHLPTAEGKSKRIIDRKSLLNIS